MVAAYFTKSMTGIGAAFSACDLAVSYYYSKPTMRVVRRAFIGCCSTYQFLMSTYKTALVKDVLSYSWLNNRGGWDWLKTSRGLQEVIMKAPTAQSGARDSCFGMELARRPARPCPVEWWELSDPS